MKIWQIALLVIGLSLTSCGAKKSSLNSAAPSQNKIEYATLPDFYNFSEDSIEGPKEEIISIIDAALQFLGTKYKYGGTTPNGMDCSGLLYTCFLQNEIPLPRSSRDMALLGEELELSKVEIGDLVFFITDRRKKDINHVGLVVGLDAETVHFIHSSTSRGVIISSLAENYWRDHFVMARRIL